jgi:hypothetical protein
MQAIRGLPQNAIAKLRLLTIILPFGKVRAVVAAGV